MKVYEVRVWPAGAGIYDDLPVVAEYEAATIGDAIARLANDPAVHAALVEEDSRMATGWEIGDSDCDDAAGRAYLSTFGFTDEPDDANIEWPILAVHKGG